MTMKAGAARVDLDFTDSIGVTTAGYGPGSPHVESFNLDFPLRARALALEDGDGRRVVFCVLDLHSGSRVVYDRLAAMFKSELGRHQLIVIGTHTHSAPGRIYGSSWYDTLSGDLTTKGLHKPTVDAIVDGAAEAIRAALDGLADAEVAWTESVALGIAMQRSEPAFGSTEAAWCADGAPGRAVRGTPAWATDPRLPVLMVRRGGLVVATLAVFACHNTALGATSVGDPDWYGRATDKIEDANPGCVALLAPGNGGDASPLSQAGILSWDAAKAEHGPGLAAERANTMFAAWSGALGAVGASVPEVRSAVTAFGPALPGGDMLAEPEFGVPTLAGAEDGRGFLFPHFAREGCRRSGHDTGEKQWPKRKALGLIQNLLNGVLHLSLHPEAAIHVVQLGDLAFVFLPGEPTAHFGQAVAHVVKAKLGGLKRVVIGGYASDYIGYLTTECEYLSQQYEGSSTLYGRHTDRSLIEAVERLLHPSVHGFLGTAALGEAEVQEAATAFGPAKIHDGVAVPALSDANELAVPRDGEGEAVLYALGRAPGEKIPRLVEASGFGVRRVVTQPMGELGMVDLYELVPTDEAIGAGFVGALELRVDGVPRTVPFAAVE